MIDQLAANLEQTIQIAREGRCSEALDRFRGILAQQPNNLSALIWFAWLTPDAQAGIETLEKALALKPDPETAQCIREGLKKLKARAY